MATDPTPEVAASLRQAEAEDRAGRPWAAAEILERALAIDPGSPSTRYRLACIRATQPRGAGDIELARRIARHLLAVHPDSPGYHYLAATAAERLGLEQESRHHLDFAIARLPADDPNLIRAHITAATARLRRGDFTAFAEIARRVERLPNRKGLLALESPVWDGRDLPGRTILIGATRDGDGDTIMFSRYLPLVRARCARVTVVCWQRLASLLAGADGVDRVIIPETPVPADAAHHDAHAYWLSLPSIFGTTLETIPAAVPYLAADPAAVERWRPGLEGIPGLKVGVAWQGDPTHNLDRLRSFPLAELAPLASVPGVSLISLQKGAGSEQLADLRFAVWDLGSAYHAGDWMTTAAVVSQLDLVIGPDTAIAHLAGALGRPVWLALSRPAEWRWLLDRDDSPWYPTIRIFRQDQLGEWDPVFERMAQALAAHPRRAATSIP